MKRVLFLLAAILVISNGVFATDYYVSLDGNDLDSGNFTNPWLSVEKAFTSVNPGDNVYFRNGTYIIDLTINTKYNVNPLSVEGKVTFSNYLDEVVILNSTIDIGIYIDRDYYEVDGFIFTAPGTFWHIGKTLSANYFKMTNCNGTVSVPGGSLNYGCVKFNSALASYGLVQDCVFYGPGGGENQNTGGVFIYRAQGIRVLNNEFYNIPNAIFYKHTGIASDTGIEFAYNYFEGNENGILTTSQYANIHDNLFISDNLLTGTDGGTGDDGLNAGSDHNNIHHNTFYDSTIKLVRSSSNDGSGAQYNIIKDNIFMNSVEVFAWVSQDHFSTLDYNIYKPSSSVINNNVIYSLSGWQSYYGQDGNSLEGVPEFIGESTFENFEDYTLSPQSVGYRSASDGRDIGANISCVGIARRCNVTIQETIEPICEATNGNCYYVSTIGSDSNNGSFSSPWQTPNKAWQDATAGDVVYFREGVFVMNQTVDTKYASSGGTFESPVIFKNYIDENVTFVKNCSEGSMFEIQKEYNYIYGMNFICTDDDSEKVFFWFGEDVSGSYSRIENCTFEILSGTGSSNTNFIRLQGERGKGAIIRNNKFTSFGNYASGVHVYRTNEFEVSNNEFYNLSLGVYVKHSNALNGTDILVKNNVFKDCSSGVYGEANNAVYFNNLFINSDMNFGDNGGVGDGGVGGDNNVFVHNTFYNEGFYFWLNGGIEEPDFCTGECNNVLRDNIFMERSSMHPYNDIFDTNILDYNLYPIGNVINRNGVSYDLSAWKIFSGQDANSISGNPIFVGGSNPVDFEDFALTSSSPGYRFASDGTDIGANVSCVGIGRGGCESIEVLPEEYNPDLNNNNLIDFNELVQIIIKYKDGEYTFSELLDFVNKWKDGEFV